MDTDQKKKVLVIDDDANLRNVMVDALTANGFEPQSATNGEEGLQKALELHPDVIMLDIMMPKMDGWQVVEKLRVDEWGKKAKIIMLTSQGQMDNIAHAVGKNVFTYIIKSELNIDNIAETINNVIKSPI